MVSKGKNKDDGVLVEVRAKMVDPDRLVPYANNAKRHPQDQIVALRRQFRAHGFDQPIVVDEDMVILKGHGRREAAIQEGMARVPVIVREGLTEAQKSALRLADNRLAETSWDMGLLRAEFGALLEMDPDFPKDMTGFPEMQFDEILNGKGTKTVSFETTGDDAHLLLLEFPDEKSMHKVRDEVEARGIKWRVL